MSVIHRIYSYNLAVKLQHLTPLGTAVEHSADSTDQRKEGLFHFLLILPDCQRNLWDRRRRLGLSKGSALGYLAALTGCTSDSAHHIAQRSLYLSRKQSNSNMTRIIPSLCCAALPFPHFTFS